jgi:hypothetical protein
LKKKQTTLIIFLIGFLVFLLYLIPNARGIRDEHMLSILSQDESIQYPYLVHMLTPGSSLFETVKNFFSYQHYFYGYFFYLYSALVLLPFRMIVGSQFSTMTQVNLLILRQLVSVLPTLTAAGLLTYLQTRFQSTWKSALLFTFLLLVPAVLLNNLWFWHPDGLTLLGVALTLFFLDRDQYRLGKNFHLAAAACGVTAAIKVIGFFFFPAILIYLILVFRQRKLEINKIIRPAVLFLLIVLAVFILLNPLLLIPQTRAQILKIQLQQNYYVTHGWEDGDTYATGLNAWLPYLQEWYALPILIIFLLGSLGYACWKGPNRLTHRLILGWIIPYSLYLIFFVATKPTHYWLPTFIPLLSNAFVLIPDDIFSTSIKRKRLTGWMAILAFAFIGLQTAQYIKRDVILVRRTLEKERLLLACNSDADNKPNGQAMTLDPARWYRVETYDTRAEPAVREFSAVRGTLTITAYNDHGQSAWACTSEAEALFSAQRSAEIYQESHPHEKVTINAVITAP